MSPVKNPELRTEKTGDLRLKSRWFKLRGLLFLDLLGQIERNPS